MTSKRSGIAWLAGAAFGLCAAGGASAADPSLPAAKGAPPAPMSDAEWRRQMENTVKSLQNELINVKAGQAAQASKPAGGTKVTTKGGLKVEGEDGQFSFNVFGRIMADADFYDQDKSRLGDGMEIRRARIGVGGVMFEDWEYKLEMDFAGNEAAMKDAYIKWIGNSPFGITVGNSHEPVSLEMLSSSRFITFMERAMPVTAFAPERHLGVKADYYGPNWSVAAGVFGRSLEDADPAAEGDQLFDVSGRVTFEPVIDDMHLVHVGVSGLFRNPSDQAVRFRDRPESHVTGVRFIDTGITPSAINPGALTAVDHLFVVDPEVALIYGPLSFQGEYFWVPINQHQEFTCPAPAAGIPAALRTCPDVTLTGWYAQVSYFLTGEMRNYSPKAAKFERIKVLRNLGHDGGLGAFEVGARVSQLDLDDGANFQKGKETNYTIGLNWYPNSHIRFMLNYILVDTNDTARGNAGNTLPGKIPGNDDPQIFELRAMVDW